MNETNTARRRPPRGLVLLLAAALGFAYLLRAAGSAAADPVFCPEGGPASVDTVVMLATSWCPYCAKARRYLQKRSVDYCEYDLDKSATGQALHRRSGHSGIPVIFIDGRVIAGYDPDELGLALHQRRTRAKPGALERTGTPFPPTSP